MKKQEIDPQELHRWLHYDPLSGEFTWLKQPETSFEGKNRCSKWVAKIWNANNAGKRAFAPRSDGYWSGSFRGQSVYAHRVAVAMMTGKWPPLQVDHINGSRGDNRWANLRIVEQAENSRNSAISCLNTSGVTGVSWSKERSKWAAYIYPEKKKRKLIGYFQKKSSAIAARRKAEHEYGYHPNHGRSPNTIIL